MPKSDILPRGHTQRIRTAPTGWGRLRAAFGLSLREMEERSGIDRGTLSRVEQSLYPSPEQARRLLAAYDAIGGQEDQMVEEKQIDPTDTDTPDETGTDTAPTVDTPAEPSEADGA